MSKFFDDTMQGLLEAVAIDKGNVPLEEKVNMPAKTYVTVNKEESLIDEVIQIRKKKHLSQSDLADMTGNNQQAISRFENKYHTPSLKFFYSIVDALGYKVQLVEK